MCRRTNVLILILLFSFGCVGIAHSETPAEADTISPVELNARRESGDAPVVIDVRTAEEYATGHIPNAVNIPPSA